MSIFARLEGIKILYKPKSEECMNLRYFIFCSGVSLYFLVSAMSAMAEVQIVERIERNNACLTTCTYVEDPDTSACMAGDNNVCQEYEICNKTVNNDCQEKCKKAGVPPEKCICPDPGGIRSEIRVRLVDGIEMKEYIEFKGVNLHGPENYANELAEGRGDRSLGWRN